MVVIGELFACCKSFCVWRWYAWSVEAEINVTGECSKSQMVLGMSLLMQVQSGEPKLFDSGNAWGDG
jgi:hypothetical protein